MEEVIAILVVIALWLRRSFKRARARRAAVRALREAFPDLDEWGTGSPTSLGLDVSEHWVPLDSTMDVAGYTLAGGVYVIDTLPPRVGDVDASLIDASLSVDRGKPDPSSMEAVYDLTYRTLTPQARAAYLEWLAEGRPAGAPIECVFLWFYGVERRVLFDAPESAVAAAEIPALMAEVERLADLYGEDSTFRSRATMLRIASQELRDERDTSFIEPPTERMGGQLPGELKLVLGTFLSQRQPIPAKWALAWFLCHPEARIRVPMTRCADAFRELFTIRYQQRYGEGLRIPPNKTLLQLYYYPSSPSLWQRIALDVGGLPDVGRLSAPFDNHLFPLATEVADDLDAYSRHLGRGGDPESMDAIALLPTELASAHPNARAFHDAVASRWPLDDPTGRLVPAAELVSMWPSAAADKLTKKEATALSRVLAAGGLGMEPDVRFDARNLSRSEHVLLFALPDLPLDSNAAAGLSKAFSSTAVVLHCAMAVVGASGTVSEDERGVLEGILGATSHLDEAERLRLSARMRWMSAENPSLAGLRKRLGNFDGRQREHVRRLLVSVAAADGHVGPEELKVLTKLYPMLGLDADQVFADVHDLSAGGAADEPVRVLPAKPGPSHAIPPRPTDDAEEPVTLAADKIAEIMAETAAVAAKLDAVFDDSATPGDAPPAPNETEPASESGDDKERALLGLDPMHADLLRRLVTRQEWARSDFDALADSLGLFPSGAMETINAAAFAACDEPLLEGEDPIEINAYAVEELLA